MLTTLFGVIKKKETENILESTINERSDRIRIPTNKSQEHPMNGPTNCSNLPEWKQRMIEKNEAAKKEVIDIMDDSMERVMAKIERKPEDQRGQAVDNYVSAVDWIMWSVKAVINGVR